MEIKQTNNSEKGMFYIETEGVTVAKMTYVWASTDRIVIEHTEVHESLKGQGAGKQMVSRSVEFAREKGIRIVPLCSFAKSVFDKTEEFRNVL